MNTEEKNILKESIKEKIEELQKDLIEMEESIQPISLDSSIGRLSRMDAINNQAVAKAAYKDKETLISRLKQSLNVIDKVEYGTCAKCSTQIPLKRLMLVPYSNLCVNCAARYR